MKTPIFSDITELSLSNPGNRPPKSDIPKEKTHTFAFSQARGEELKVFRNGEAPWKDAPADLTAGLLLAMARDMADRFGENGAMQQLGIAACVAASRSGHPQVLDMTLECTRPDGNFPSVSMRLRSRPEQPSSDDGASVSIKTRTSPMSIVRGLVDTAKAAKAWLDPKGKQEEKVERATFNPLAEGALDDATLHALVCQAEQALGKPHSYIDLFCTAALPLVAWAAQEKLNATNSELVITGASNKGEDVYPGQQVVVATTVRLHQREPNPNETPSIELGGTPRMRRPA